MSVYNLLLNQNQTKSNYEYDYGDKFLLKDTPFLFIDVRSGNE